MSSASGDATISGGGSEVVRVALADAPVRRTIDLGRRSRLIVCVEGACAAVRVTLDGDAVLDRTLTDDERAAGRVELALDRPEFQQFTRFSTLSLEVRDDFVDHHRGGSPAGDWKLAATLLIRGARARRLIGCSSAITLLVAAYWVFVLADVGSIARFAMDVGGFVLALACLVVIGRRGSAYAPSIAVGCGAAVVGCSAISLSMTTSVAMAENADVSGVVHRPERLMTSEVEVQGESDVMMRGQRWRRDKRCSPDRRSWPWATIGTRRMTVSRRGNGFTIQRAAADALQITGRLAPDCVDGEWLTFERDEWIRVEATAENEGFALPSVALRWGPTIHRTDLHLGAPRPIRLHSIGARPNLELHNESAVNVRLHFDPRFDQSGLWVGELGGGWRGHAFWRLDGQPNGVLPGKFFDFVCERAANTLVTANVDPRLIRRIDASRFRFDFERQDIGAACFRDDGTAFDAASSVTIAVGDERASREAWRREVSNLDPAWRTIRWVRRDGDRDEPLAITTRLDEAAQQSHLVHVHLSESLADAREIAAVDGGRRFVLWRRLSHRPTLVVLSGVMDALFQGRRGAIMVRVGEGGTSRELCGELATEREGHVLREPTPGGSSRMGCVLRSSDWDEHTP